MGCGASTPAGGNTPPALQLGGGTGGGGTGAASAPAATQPATGGAGAATPTSGSERRGFRSQLIKKSQRAWYDTYIKETTLGHGMTGKVYRIKDRNTGERYALKMMDASKVNPELLQDLVNEIELLQSLDHPNVIKLHEYFYDGDTIMESSNLFLVMELCEGGELFDRLHMQTHSHYTEAKAAGIVTMMLKAIAYIHSKGVSHRDLKLENFLFESRADDSNLKLIDFGLSARYTAPGGVQRMTTMVGTPYYIAPEVLTAGRAGYTPACDMWSLGVITYMLLSGTPPFKGRHDADVLNSVKRGKYNLSGRRWEHVSDAAKDFIRRLLVYRPSGRMSASAALDDPWITRAAAQRARREPSGSTQLDEEIVGNLRAFTHFSALKRAALEAIAFQVAAPKLAKLRSVFLDMDKDRTGLISLAEMQEVLVERGGMQPAEVQDIFSRLDQDGQDTISYSEFLAATLSKRYYMREGRIRAAFQKLDVDGSGYITPENLREILGDDFTPERVAEMIREADTLGDGRISYQEFLALFREEAGAALLPGATPTPRHAASGSGTRAYYDDMGLAINPAAEREAAQAARAARAEAAAEARRQRIVQARDRNGNILAHDDGGAADALRRGRKFIDHQTTQVLQREGKRDMLRGDLRFHAPVASGGHRTTLLKQGGHQATKYSSVLGMGRADTPSHGAADNFQYSQYDPAWAAATHGETPHGAPSSPPSHSGARSPLASAGSAAVESGDGAARDAFAARLDAKLKNSFAFGGRQREPNRVFDDNVDSARLAPAVPDREAQHKRIMADIDHSRKAAKARAGTAASSARAPRQHSLVAEARLLEASRRRAALDRDIAMVRALK